jgi:glycosyltransferase involved in cell wall biosynthesis
MRVAMLTGGDLGEDFAGSYVSQRLAFFQERGADILIFVESAARLPQELEPITAACPGGQVDAEGWRFLTAADLVIADYHGPSALHALLPRLAGGRARILVDCQGQQAVRPEILCWADTVLVHDPSSRHRLWKASGLPADRLRRLDAAPQSSAALERSGGALPRRVAVVSLRYGLDFAGGAETSLRTIAEALHRRGHAVEVFATCTRSADHWQNVLPATTTHLGGIAVHRFPIDAYDREQHLESVHSIASCRGPIPAAVEEKYLANTVRSTALVDALRQRLDELDAIIVGPYLFGLTLAVAQAFPERTLVLPCFHDEPLARLRAWQTYAKVGGLLYHSPEEWEFADAELGLRHANAVEIGTCLARSQVAGRATPPCPGRYLVYCGRYAGEKAVPRLVDYARRYQRLQPGRFTFVFLGQGDVTLPKEDWLVDLGFVSEQRKRQVLAGADALVQLSRNESLSLVVLEAWAAGVPVVVDQGCAVLAGQVQRSRGGCAVKDFAEFAHALDDLWDNRLAWRQRGTRGRAFARRRYGSEEAYVERLVQAVTAMHLSASEPPVDAQPAARSAAWWEAFGALVDELLHQEPRAYHERLEIQPQQDLIVAAGTAREVLVPVRIANHGSHPAAAEGPGCVIFHAQVVADDGLPAAPQTETALPRLLLPGQAEAAVVSVLVPGAAGCYRLHLWPARVACEPEAPVGASRAGASGSQANFTLLVLASGSATPPLCGPALDRVKGQVANAQRQGRLPQDYRDVTEGHFARWKRWLKRKLLNNFKRAYVDVLSQQQSEVNGALADAVETLTRCCATLDHAVRVLQDRVSGLENQRGCEERGPQQCPTKEPWA